MGGMKIGPALVAILHLGALPVSGQVASEPSSRVEISNEGWVLAGDFRLPSGAPPYPAVLMLNQAAGSRGAYANLAALLAQRGIATLSLDLRGHGESTNLGRFIPGESPRDPLIWDAEADIVAAQKYLASDVRIDGESLGVVGASYSGEEAAEAGLLHGYATAYVLLSPGSLSERSIQAIDTSDVPWLFISARDDRFLTQVTSDVQTKATSAKVIIIPGSDHATDMLVDRADLVERIANWLAYRLR